MNSVAFYEAYNALRPAIDEACQEILVFNKNQPKAENTIFDDNLKQNVVKTSTIEKKEITAILDSGSTPVENNQSHTNKESIANAYAVELFENMHLDDLLTKLKNGLIEQIRNSQISLCEDDPIYAKIDVFSIIEWSSKEVPHTMMLAFFLDKEGKHGLGIIPMEYFLKTIRSVYANCSITISENRTYTVKAEKFIKIPSSKEKRRLDLFVDISGIARLIIEGKVESQEGRQQLPDYYEWGESEKKYGIENYYIFLTKEGDESSHPGWISISWKIIAYSFCSMLYDNRIIERANTNPDVRISLWSLRLWLSTILHHVLQIPVIKREMQEQMSISKLSEFVSYLQGISEFQTSLKTSQFSPELWT